MLFTFVRLMLVLRILLMHHHIIPYAISVSLYINNKKIIIQCI